MSKLNLSSVVNTTSSHNIVTVSIQATGVEVEVKTAVMRTHHSVHWDDMTDVEYLSLLFADERVAVFRAIVELLGKVYASKDIYRALV